MEQASSSSESELIEVNDLREPFEPKVFGVDNVSLRYAEPLGWSSKFENSPKGDMSKDGLTGDTNGSPSIGGGVPSVLYVVCAGAIVSGRVAGSGSMMLL